MTVEIVDKTGGRWVPDGELCRRWIESALRSAAPARAAAVSLCFVGARESEQLNRRYRRRPRPADVLAFPLRLPAELDGEFEPAPIGDIVVCAELAEREAAARRRPLEQHWAHLVVHGCLHLLGFDHENETAAAEMEETEVEILRNLGIPNPYLVS